MKPFYVTAEYVDKYGGQVGRAQEDARDGKHYAESNGEISVGEQGWLALLGDAHKTIMHALERELDGLAESCSTGSAALHQAAAYYAHTDKATAERLDATLTDHNDRDAYTAAHYRDGKWVAS